MLGITNEQIENLMASEVFEADTFWSFVEDGYYNDFDGTAYYVKDGKTAGRVNLMHPDPAYTIIAWYGA